MSHELQSLPTGSFGSFFALMPPDNPTTVPLGGAVQFPQDGPSNGIARTGPSTFNIPLVGTYQVNWQVSIGESGQLQLRLNGVILPETTAGRSAGTSHLTNCVFITTTVPNSVLELVNPPGNVVALTVTPNAGGTVPASAWLIIQQLV